MHLSASLEASSVQMDDDEGVGGVQEQILGVVSGDEQRLWSASSVVVMSKRLSLYAADASRSASYHVLRAELIRSCRHQTSVLSTVMSTT